MTSERRAADGDEHVGATIVGNQDHKAQESEKYFLNFLTISAVSHHFSWCMKGF